MKDVSRFDPWLSGPVSNSDSESQDETECDLCREGNEPGFWGKERKEQLKLCEKCKTDPERLMEEIFEGRRENAGVLIDAGVNVNPIDVEDDDCTPLFMAACLGYVEIVDALLKAGADPNLGRSVVYAASATYGWFSTDDREHQRDLCIRRLAEAGADLNKISVHYNCTPLVIAKLEEQGTIVDTLLRLGADINCQDQKFQSENGHRPTLLMHMYIDNRPNNIFSLSKVRDLLRAGAIVNLSPENISDRCCEDAYAYEFMFEHEHKKGASTLEFFIYRHQEEFKCDSPDEYRKFMEDLCLHLFSAGEKLTCIECANYLPDVLRERMVLNTKAVPTLKQRSRQAIRNHLMELSPLNLFVRIPKLQLPKIMGQYLLYNLPFAKEAVDGLKQPAYLQNINDPWCETLTMLAGKTWDY